MSLRVYCSDDTTLAYIHHVKEGVRRPRLCNCCADHRRKLDLLVRVRYLNPLPPPPFPPKLVNIPTNVSRLGDPSYLNDYVATAPLPMLVDAEMGMPLDLNQYDGVWEGNDASTPAFRSRQSSS